MFCLTNRLRSSGTWTRNCNLTSDTAHETRGEIAVLQPIVAVVVKVDVDQQQRIRQLFVIGQTRSQAFFEQ
jgi:hypothetical protein